MNVLIRVGLLLTISLCKIARGQTSYKVVDIPQSITSEIPTIKDSLNLALKNVTTDKDAFTVINSKLRNYKNLPLRLRKKTGDGHFQYAVYYVSAPVLTQTRLIDIKATKDFIDETIYKRHQFASALSDTVAVLDTLRLRIFPSDFNWKITDYILRFTSEGETFESALSSEGANTLLLCSDDLPEKAVTYSCTLRHKGTEKELASFSLIFLDEPAQAELSRVAESLNEKDTPLITRIRHLQVYGNGYWGNMQAENIRDWLLKQDVR